MSLKLLILTENIRKTNEQVNLCIEFHYILERERNFNDSMTLCRATLKTNVLVTLVSISTIEEVISKANICMLGVSYQDNCSLDLPYK